jgi:hypothetical protein
VHNKDGRRATRRTRRVQGCSWIIWPDGLTARRCAPASPLRSSELSSVTKNGGGRGVCGTCGRRAQTQQGRASPRATRDSNAYGRRQKTVADKPVAGDEPAHSASGLVSIALGKKHDICRPFTVSSADHEHPAVVFRRVGPVFLKVRVPAGRTGLQSRRRSVSCSRALRKDLIAFYSFPPEHWTSCAPPIRSSGSTKRSAAAPTQLPTGVTT